MKKTECEIDQEPGGGWDDGTPCTVVCTPLGNDLVSIELYDSEGMVGRVVTAADARRIAATIISCVGRGRS